MSIGDPPRVRRAVQDPTETGPATGPPPLRRGFGEARAVVDAVRGLRALPSILRREPPPVSRTVLVLPGYIADDTPTWPLRAVLARDGHDVHPWGLGRNTGDVDRLLPRVEDLARRLCQDAGEPLDLVGWSLGGVLAREVARCEPESVRRVVTLGAPVAGGPKYTATARVFGRQMDLDVVAQEIRDRHASDPLARPVTAIWSRRDGIVHWRAQIDRWTDDVEHVEVDATHLGLLVDPVVIATVRDRVAAEV